MRRFLPFDSRIEGRKALFTIRVRYADCAQNGELSGRSQSVPAERFRQVDGGIIDLEHASATWGICGARAVDDRRRVEPDIAAVRKARALASVLDDGLDTRFRYTA